jgi:AcrR family transcriptional regulator
MATTRARPTKRSYNSSRRQAQAAQTRSDVLAAATELFSDLGWAGTTLAAIADAAGVSVETIYNGFGSKKGLLRAAMEVAVVGDDEPIPLVERPEFAALREGDFDERIARGISLLAEIHGRSAKVWEAFAEAAQGDAEVEAWRQELEAGRLVDTRRSLEVVLGGPVDERLVTVLWVLYSPEAYLKLVGDGGLDRAEYESLLVDASRRLSAR